MKARMIFTVAFFWTLLLCALIFAQEGIPLPSPDEGTKSDSDKIVEAITAAATAQVMATDRVKMAVEQSSEKQIEFVKQRFDASDAKLDALTAELLSMKQLLAEIAAKPIVNPEPEPPCPPDVTVIPQPSPLVANIMPAIPSKSTSKWIPRDGSNVITHYDSVHLRGAATTLTTGQKRALHDSDHDQGWQPGHGTPAPSSYMFSSSWQAVGIPAPSGGSGSSGGGRNCPGGICNGQRIWYPGKFLGR